MRAWKRGSIVALLLASHAPSLSWAQGVPFADDFETGTLLSTEPSPGQWTRIHLEGSNALQVSAVAAHRGSWGYRFTDNESITAAGGEGLLNVRIPPLAGNVYTRFWMRINPITRAGNLHFIHVLSPGFVRSLAASTAFNGELSLAGSDAAAQDEISQKQGVFLGEEWHLVEAAIEGVGTATGKRKLWLDGALALEQSGVNLSGVTVSELSLGEPYTDNRSFTGSVDFDDVRISTSPPASRLQVALETDRVESRTCLPVTLSLRDSSGLAAAAPYAVEVELDAGEEGAFASDSACGDSIVQAVIPALSTEWKGFVWFEQPGISTLRASHGDFLGGSVSPNIALGQRRELDLGCGSTEGKALPLGALAFLIAAARRRSKARNQRGARSP